MLLYVSCEDIRNKLLPDLSEMLFLYRAEEVVAGAQEDLVGGSCVVAL